MAQFFDISAPPQGLESLDHWGSLDSLPASLDSGVWTRAGVYGLSVGEAARASARLGTSHLACLGGTLRATSAGALQSSVLKSGRAGGTAAASGKVAGLRLRFSGGMASGRAGGSLLGVGVLYVDMGGACRSAGAMHGLITASVVAGGGVAAGGSLGLNFVRLLSLRGGGCASPGVELRPKGWDWLPHAPAVQGWEPCEGVFDLSNLQKPAESRWRGLERGRSSAWH